MNLGINTFVPISLLTVVCMTTAVYGIKCTNRTFVSTESQNGTECSSRGCVVAYCIFGPSAHVLYQSCVTDQDNCAQMAKKCEVTQHELGAGKLEACKECTDANYCNAETLVNQQKVKLIEYQEIILHFGILQKMLSK
uniref:UPAR/Ly6 domain-containing protein n=1 Tax=Globodera pallida TaxID=36090 RepID=A0A183BYM7_GLOPA